LYIKKFSCILKFYAEPAIVDAYLHHSPSSFSYDLTETLSVPLFPLLSPSVDQSLYPSPRPFVLSFVADDSMIESFCRFVSFV